MNLQKQHGWARFVSMQDHYNLLAREEEREMIPLCLDEGVGTIIWSPLARGRLARAWDDAKSTTRAETDGAYIQLNDVEIASLKRPYTPRYDFQGISDEAELQKIRARIPGYVNA